MVSYATSHCTALSHGTWKQASRRTSSGHRQTTTQCLPGATPAPPRSTRQKPRQTPRRRLARPGETSPQGAQGLRPRPRYDAPYQTTSDGGLPKNIHLPLWTTVRLIQVEAMMPPQRRLLRRQHRGRTPPTAPRLPATPSSLQTRNQSPTPTIRLEHRPSEATMSTMTSNPRKHGPATPRRKQTRRAIHSMHMLTRPLFYPSSGVLCHILKGSF